MLIIDDLRALRQKFINRSSLKEKVFYQFLVNAPLSYPKKNNLARVEQICCSVFCIDIPPKIDLTNLIEAQRRTQPIGGMHYTENLIELIAMALENPEAERETLKAYSENHSTRDFYILHVLFPTLGPNIPTAQGTIDEIALHLYKGSFPEKWKDLLFMGLGEASDLVDLYIIEQWYKQAIDDNPIVHRTNDIIYIKSTLAQVVEKTERRVKLAIKIVSVLLLCSISYWLFPLIVRNWDQVEPIMAVIEILGSLIFTVIIIVAGFIPDRIKFLNSLREKIIDWVFRKKGFKRSELKETLNRLTNQNEK